MKDTIVFVYNADGGLFNTLSNTGHKIFSPETYRCYLCSITYSVLGMKKEYKAFINSIGRPLEFLHHDELKKRYHVSNISLPAVFSKKNGKLRLIIESGLIEDCQDLSDLKRLIREKISM